MASNRALGSCIQVSLSQSLDTCLEACWACVKESKSLPAARIKEAFDLYSTSPAQSRGLYTQSLVKLLPFVQKRLKVQLCNRLIRILVDENRPEESLNFLRVLQLANTGAFSVEYETLEKLLLSASYYKDVEFAWQTVRSMLGLYDKLYSRTWGMFLGLVLQQDHYEALEFCWKLAAIPGYVVLDDHSYTQMARIAAQHGNMEMCNWAVIGLQERNGFFGVGVPHAAKLRGYSIEAAAMHSTLNGFKSSFKTACRLIKGAKDLAGQIRCHHLPRYLEAQAQHFPTALNAYNELLEDPGSHELVKTLFFNLILKHHVAADRAKALDHYHQASQELVGFNEDSVLLLLELARQMEDFRFAQHVASLWDSKRVQRASNWARF